MKKIALFLALSMSAAPVLAISPAMSLSQSLHARLVGTNGSMADYEAIIASVLSTSGNSSEDQLRSCYMVMGNDLSPNAIRALNTIIANRAATVRPQQDEYHFGLVTANGPQFTVSGGSDYTAPPR